MVIIDGDPGTAGFYDETIRKAAAQWHMKEQENLRDLVKENWEHHREVKADAIKDIDNITFVFATGAIALSVGAIAYLPPTFSGWQANVLMVAWVFLIASMAFMGISRYFDAHSSRLHMDMLQGFLESGYTMPKNWNLDPKKHPDGDRIYRAGQKCAFFRLFSIACLIVGALFLVIFGGSILLSKTVPTQNQSMIQSSYEQGAQQVFTTTS